MNTREQFLYLYNIVRKGSDKWWYVSYQRIIKLTNVMMPMIGAIINATILTELLWLVLKCHDTISKIRLIFSSMINVNIMLFLQKVKAQNSYLNHMFLYNQRHNFHWICHMSGWSNEHCIDTDNFLQRSQHILKEMLYIQCIYLILSLENVMYWI